MEFKTTSLFIGLLLATLVYLGESNVISTDDVPSLKAVDQAKVDEWVREFYDRCGETYVVDSMCSGGNTGPHCGPEVVKKCIGDKDGCVEDKNCNFAVAISETAQYRPELFTPSSTTTLHPGSVFQKYLREVQRYNVKVLDSCHLKPVAGDSKFPGQKFVGVAFGPVNTAAPNNNTHRLDCEREPTMKDFRAYFFVSDINNCTLQPDLPVHPYLSLSAGGTGPIPNQFELDVTTWKTNECRTLNNYMADSNPNITMHSGFMSNLLVYYYGTPAYVANNYTYADAGNWLEPHGIDSVPTFLHPVGTERDIATEAPPPSGSVLLQPSVYVFVTITLSAIMSLF